MASGFAPGQFSPYRGAQLVGRDFSALPQAPDPGERDPLLGRAVQPLVEDVRGYQVERPVGLVHGSVLGALVGVEVDEDIQVGPAFGMGRFPAGAPFRARWGAMSKDSWGGCLVGAAHA